MNPAMLQQTKNEIGLPSNEDASFVENRSDNDTSDLNRKNKGKANMLRLNIPKTEDNNKV